MTQYVPPKKNDANGFIFYTALAYQAANGSFIIDPTLATGDVKISKDGGALANLGTTPAATPAGSVCVKVTLSQAEINADNITIQFRDVAGAQWCDKLINFQTVARQLDDLAYPAVSGRSFTVQGGAVLANAGFWLGTAIATPDTAGYPKTTIKTGTGAGELQIASGIVQGNIEQVHAQANSAANLAYSTRAIGRGTVTAGSSTTSVTTSTFVPTGAVADQFKNRTLLFDVNTTTSTLRGVAATISASTNAAAPTFTVSTLPATPASGDTFSVL